MRNELSPADENNLHSGITDDQNLDKKDKNKDKGDKDKDDKNKDKDDNDNDKSKNQNKDGDKNRDDDKNREDKEKDKDKDDDGDDRNQDGNQNNDQNEGQNSNASAPQAPSLLTSASTVEPGGAVTVTLTNGSPGANQWIALAATGAADTSYLQSIHVGPAVTTRTWTVTMPMTAGTYEFRLFLNGNRGHALRRAMRADDEDFPSEPPARNTRAATSPTVTVVAPPPPPPTVILPAGPTLSVSAQNVSGGASVTVTLTNAFGGTYDWVALAAAGAADTSYLQWTYIGAGVTTFPWTVTMPTTPGTYEFRLFLNGIYTRAATSPGVTVN